LTTCTMKNSVLFFSFLLVLPFATSLHFKISRFIQGDPSITYQGDATPNGAIELNSADYTCRVGWATYAKKVAIWDPKTERATDFTTSFTFKIDTRKRNLTEFGHGFAFFLAPQGIHIFPNSAGGFLGLFNETNGYSSRFPLVHIEFDTFYNNQWDPFDITSHVGINNNSLASSNYTSWNASLHSQETCHARITYDSTSKNLSIAWSYEGTSHPSSLSYIIDLAKVLPAEVTIGFSGSTGAKMEAHRILSWEFNSTLDAAEPRERTQNMTGIIVGVSLAGFVLLTSLYGRGELISAIDHQMGKDFDMKQAECLMIVGLWCAHPDINSRPSIKQAIQVLNFEAPLPNLPHKMPIATYHVSSISGGVATTSFSSAQLGR
ncbi:hypothetical protein HID58_081311, partial [Brassica napus]